MNDLNFFSGYIVQRKEAYRKSFAAYAVIAAILLAVVSSYAITELTVVSIQAQTSTLQKYLSDPATRAQQQELAALKQKLDILTQYGSELEAAKSGVEGLDTLDSALLEAFNTTLPGDIVMDTLSYTRDSIAMTGTANSRVPVAELSHNLDALGLFSEVHVAVISSETEGRGSFKFTASCRLKGAVKQ